MSDIERLHGLDAAFLYLETATQHMNVCGVMVLELPESDTAAGGAKKPSRELQRLADAFLRRLVTIPAFRRRLVNAPLNLTHPAWTDAPAFRPREHLRFATVAAPGTAADLAALVGRIAAAPLARDRPLWELWAIDGLEHGRSAIIVKAHHVMLDGVSGLGVLAQLFSTEPEERYADVPALPPVETSGWDSLRFAGSAFTSIAQAPADLVRVLARTARSLPPLARTLAGLSGSTNGPALTSARTTLNRALTPERAVAFGRVSLASIKQIKNAFAVTVNDVVLAACTLALRTYLTSLGEHPGGPIIASVPVSEHESGEQSATRNRVSAMLVPLPVDVEDASDVVRIVHERALAAKKIYASLGRAMLADWAELAPPTLFAAAASLYSRWRLAERVPPMHSVVISNVAGSPVPLYAGKARLVAAYPLGPVLEGAGLNISVASYAQSVDFGLIACPGSVAQPWDIVHGFERAVAFLEARSARAA